MGSLRHVDPGVQLTRGEYDADTAHEINGGAAGEILYFNGLELISLALGGAGQVLGVNPGVGPIWTAAPSFGGTLNVEVASSIALTVSRGAGITDYAFQVDTSPMNAATGVRILSQQAGSGVDIEAISSGTNEDIRYNAKGSGTFTIGNISTGNIVLARATTLSLGGTVTAGGWTVTTGNIGVGTAANAGLGVYVTGSITSGAASQYGMYSDITTSIAATTASNGVVSRISTAAAAYTSTIVRNFYAAPVIKGAGSTIGTIYGLHVDANTVVTTNTYGVYIEAQSGGASLNIGLYNAGTTTLVGLVTISGGVDLAGAFTVTSASASAFAVGRLGATTPAFVVDASTGTQVTGIKVTGLASGGGARIATVGGGTNENLAIDIKGTATLVLLANSGAGSGLDIRGNTTFTSVVALGSAGSATAPMYSFSADPNTGIYNANADEVTLAIGGARRYWFDNNGILGANWTTLQIVNAGSTLSIAATGFTVNATLTARSIVSATTNTYDLGANGNLWNDIWWVGKLYMGGSGGWLTSSANTLYIQSGQNAAGSNLVTILDNGGNDVFRLYAPGKFQIVQQAKTVGNTSNLMTMQLTPAAHTNVPASTEMNSIQFDMSRVLTWATGAITNQREVIINAPTYAFAGASVITNAATLSITGAPIAGTNATITNSHALWISSGNIRMDATDVIRFTAATSDITGGATAIRFLNAARSLVNLGINDDGTIALHNKIYPGTDAGVAQTASGLYAGTGAPNNANGANGDVYFRGDGGAATTVYHKRAGAWVGVV